jgi:protein-tyrosine phosphatase
VTSVAPLRLLTVCLGNICRSPTAEAALRAAAAEAGLAVDIGSAGTGGWHVGAPPDPRMRAAAAEVGLHLDGAAQQVTAADLATSDLVLAMDASNLRDLQRLAVSAGIDVPMRRFRSFDPQAVADLDVPDPYYGGPEGFTEVAALCRRAAAALIEQLATGVDVADLQHADDPLLTP